MKKQIRPEGLFVAAMEITLALILIWLTTLPFVGTIILMSLAVMCFVIGVGLLCILKDFYVEKKKQLWASDDQPEGGK